MREKHFFINGDEVSRQVLVAFLREPLNQSQVTDFCVTCEEDKFRLFQGAFMLGVQAALVAINQGAITPVGNG